MAASVLTDEEMSAAPSSPAGVLTDEQMAGGAAPAAAAKEPGFFARALDTLKRGKHAVATVGADIYHHPLDTLANPSKRRELERGIDDIVTLGYGQRGAAALGDLLGDKERGTSLNDTQAADAAAAPEYRMAGNVGGAFLPNPLARVGGAVAGKAVGALGGVAGRVAPELVAKGAGAVAKVASKVPAPIAGAAKGLGAYQLTAVPSAALSADAEGHRLEAAKAAATDPAGILLSGAGGGLGEGAKRLILNSKGGKARALIDSERSGGAHAGVLTPGKGGVFAEELKGLGTDDAATGRAAQIGAQGVVSHLENQHATEHGYPYREGPDLVQKARADRVEAIRSGEATASAAGRDTREEIRDVNEEARMHAHGAAPELLSKLDEQHRVEASEPYRVLKEMVDNSPAAGKPRDASDLLATLHEAKYDFETDNAVRPQIAEYIDMLERYRDPTTGIVMVPERQLNGLRRNIMGAARVGMTDAPRGAEAPLRKAAFITKQMVDSGPYAVLNSIYAEGSAAREAAREGLGLKGRLGTNRAAEEAALKARMVRSVKDPTAFPGEAAPEGADMGPYRQRIKDAEARRLAAEEGARTSKTEALAAEAGTRARVEKGTDAALPDRKLLGLNENIGQEGVDQNQVRIALERQVRNSNAAGANKANLPAFREKHPSQGRNIDLPVLQNARNDLSFRIKPKHGGLAAQAAADVSPLAGAALVATHHPIAAGVLAVAQNKAPIAGRVLYTPAKAISAGLLGARAGRIVGGTIGAKVKRAIEAQKMENRP